jgi:hypothetical protein
VKLNGNITQKLNFAKGKGIFQPFRRLEVGITKPQIFLNATFFTIPRIFLLNYQ